MSDHSYEYLQLATAICPNEFGENVKNRPVIVLQTGDKAGDFIYFMRVGTHLHRSIQDEDYSDAASYIRDKRAQMVEEQIVIDIHSSALTLVQKSDKQTIVAQNQQIDTARLFRMTVADFNTLLKLKKASVYRVDKHLAAAAMLRWLNLAQLNPPYVSLTNISLQQVNNKYKIKSTLNYAHRDLLLTEAWDDKSRYDNLVDKTVFIPNLPRRSRFDKLFVMYDLLLEYSSLDTVKYEAENIIDDALASLWRCGKSHKCIFKYRPDQYRLKNITTDIWSLPVSHFKLPGHIDTKYVDAFATAKSDHDYDDVITPGEEAFFSQENENAL